MEGIIVVDKPTGITSHDVVAKVRRKFKIKRVGHAGTLDPLATGVLVILVGKATKLSNQFIGLDKAYRSTLRLGMSTDSADTEGNITSEKSFDHVADDEIKSSFKKFEGEIDQLPPMYSAVKIKGRKLYEYARKGIEVKREPRRVKIINLIVEEIKLPYVKFYLECSKGTYVRQLASDIGDDLKCGACISQLQRVSVGEFNIKDAVSIEEINESHLRNWQSEKTV